VHRDFLVLAIFESVNPDTIRLVSNAHPLHQEIFPVHTVNQTLMAIVTHKSGILG
jgi:hypothetical protein